MKWCIYVSIWKVPSKTKSMVTTHETQGRKLNVQTSIKNNKERGTDPVPDAPTWMKFGEGINLGKPCPATTEKLLRTHDLVTLWDNPHHCTSTVLHLKITRIDKNIFEFLPDMSNFSHHQLASKQKHHAHSLWHWLFLVGWGGKNGFQTYFCSWPGYALKVNSIQKSVMA